MTNNESNRHYISVDWGTSSLRVRLVQISDHHDVVLIAQVKSPHGIASVHERVAASGKDRASVFGGVLHEQLLLLAEQTDMSLAKLPVMISGMAGSSLGWRELPYQHVPFSLAGSGLTVQKLDPGMPMPCGPIYLISGVCSDHDVMRGEETEILGLFADVSLADYADHSLVILPGTHSKHVLIRRANVVDFSTCMTGELFDILSRCGVLSASLGQDSCALNLQDQHATRHFEDGVRKGLCGALLQDLFQVRTRALLAHQSSADNRAWLRGLLLGAEIFCLKIRYEQMPRIVIAPGKHLCDAYRIAFEISGINCVLLNADLVERSAVMGHRVLLEQLHLAAK